MSRMPSSLFSLLLFCCLTGLNAKELPLQSFSQLPTVAKPDLSPNGQQIAFVQNYLDPETSVLTTVNLLSGAKKMLVQSDNEKIKLNWFRWANEQTIIVSVRYASKQRGVAFTETRLLAFDVQGDDTNQRNLIRHSGVSGPSHISQFQDNVVSFLPDDPDHILVAIDLDVANLPSVYKLNINNKRKTRIEKGKMEVRDWMADQQGNLRLGVALNYES
ncbi:MAG: S9 family peptidase, partial [Paraglaciecola sp.]|nr:S9 family peptidase [Paraglaciecola sp.]